MKLFWPTIKHIQKFLLSETFGSFIFVRRYGKIKMDITQFCSNVSVNEIKSLSSFQMWSAISFKKVLEINLSF